MIKIEKTEVFGWEAAVRGMRNPMNSWDKSDSYPAVNCRECPHDPYVTGICEPAKHREECSKHEFLEIGKNDLKLMQNLVAAGTDHSKFMRMINVTCDITAPLYWVAEHDTYKVGTTRNSCSFMHRGTSKRFEIDDFSVHDTRIYEALKPLKKKASVLMYPYETSEYKIYTTRNNRKYKVFRNGKVYRCEFDKIDSYKNGRVRHFEEKEVKPSMTASGYYEVNIGGRCGEKWLLHRLVACLWISNPMSHKTVNHINGDKGNNSIENLEWMSLGDNIKDAFDYGLYENVKSIHHAYIAWKTGHVNIEPIDKLRLKTDYDKNKDINKLSDEYNLSKKQVQQILYARPHENEELFYSCQTWENVLKKLNELRDEYIDTQDENVFFAIRQILPQGYNVKYTWHANYAVLRNIYHARKTHRLPEWLEFCHWIEQLPYSELITGETNDTKKE